jgi:quercetin 2,3-dioxygenase
MSQCVFHAANTRGYANHGWLEANHSFSFARYYDPERVHFGALRVLNDDAVAPGMGFGTHPHDNMEIITIPLEGALAHKDSMGHAAAIHKGEIQVMSAGVGVTHSEFNHHKDQWVRLLQIWVFPKLHNVTPRYDQQNLDWHQYPNQLRQVVSPNPDDEGSWIYQDAWFHVGVLDEGFQTVYSIKKPGNGVYAFVIEGNIKINNQTLSRRDAIGIWNTECIDIEVIVNNSQVLLIDVPMDF